MKPFNKLLQISALSGSSTLIKMLTGMLSLKIVALYTGPEGIAILSQFMTLVSILSTIAGGGIGLGVIKYVAEYAQSKELPGFLSTATFYTIFFSLLTMLSGLIFSKELSIWILGSVEFEYLIFWMSIAQILIAMHLLFCSCINGFGEIRLLVSISVISSIISLFLIASFAFFYQVKGTLLAFVLSQTIAIFISTAFLYRRKWFPFLFSINVKTTHLFNLSRYSLMSIVSTLTVPIAQIIVRNDLNTLFGWHSVGYWQAVVRLSDAYLLFVTTALTAYYLPRLSQLQTRITIKKEVVQAYYTLMPTIAIILFLIYLCRGIIINVLYSKTFSPATQLFAYQLTGDFFRIAGWLFTYLLIAKSWTKTYVATEIILSLIFVGIAHVFSRTYGLVGVTYAFALTYFIYWLMMAGVGMIYFKQEDS